MAGVDNLIQEGGDRYAAGNAYKAILLDAVKAALMTVSDVDIREAFGMGKWRVVTAEHKARFAAVKAPLVLDAILAGMIEGVAGGKLAIAGFMTIEVGEEPEGELFPVCALGVCHPDGMVLADVTLTAGADDGLSVKGQYDGRWARFTEYGWVEGFPEEYAVIDAAAGLYAVPGKITMMLDYGGYFVEARRVVDGLAVRGHIEDQALDGGYLKHNLVVDDARPDVSGVVPFAGYSQPGFGGPYQQWILGRPYYMPGYPSRVFSLREVELMAGRLAESVLASQKIHALDADAKPLDLAAWKNCFPRQKWICGIDRININTGRVEKVYSKVEWINRANWMARYNGARAALKAAGYIVPEDLKNAVTSRRRIYAKFAKEFIDAVNA